MASIINALSSGAGGLVTSGDTSGVLQLQNNSSASVTLDASGNVGIGTTSPASSLDVQAVDARSIIRLTATTGTNPVYSRASNTGGFLYLGRDGSGGTDFGAGAYAAGVWSTGAYPMVFGTNGTERMRIASDGKIAMGTSTTGGWPSDAFFESRASSGWAVSAYNTSASSAGAFLARIDNTSRSLQEFYYSTTYVGKITTNGSTTTYGSASDYRLKDNVVAMTGALQKVALLKPVTYTWKNSGINDNGFIAHELAEVLPNAVNGTKDAVDDNGNPVYQTVDTSFLVATLTAAIQEMKAIIDAQSARINALENK